MKQRILVLDGIKKPKSGTFPMISIRISSRSGGLRRWLPTRQYFPDNQELLDIVENVVIVVDDLQDQVHSIDEPDLYVEPQTPLEEYQQEIRECREWKEEHPEMWQTIFKDELDVETYAFCILPTETREKLVN